MDEEIIEEFNEKFATVEEALKYIADSQAKSEFIHKRDVIRHNKEIAEIRELQRRNELQIEKNERLVEKTQLQLEQTQRHLNHITKVLRFSIEEYEFQEEKLEKAGKILISKRKNNL